MSKRTDAQVLLKLPFPLEIIAKITSYRDGWCGATEQDCYQLLKHWQDFQPKQIDFGANFLPL